MCERTGHDGALGGANPLRRTLDLCVFAPVGMAVTAVEDLPGLIDKGRRRVELQLANARVVGKFVVTKTERRVADRIGALLHNGAPPTTAPARAPAAGTVDAPAKPVPDTAAGAVVGSVLADYDTLSASQVVRRLESLGPDELQAVQRYEASTRNRRTILNRAGQLLDERRQPPPDS
ncbi:MAG TPA: hypothetical protein VMF35_15750 [Acidimicrobiales bacterium]|nr:hypothetical protein [Acidimicrobiales bacterium]